MVRTLVDVYFNSKVGSFREWVNLPPEQAVNYFVGKHWNVGFGKKENKQLCTKATILETEIV